MTGEKTAEEIYGAKGFVSHHNVGPLAAFHPCGTKGEGDGRIRLLAHVLGLAVQTSV